MRGWIWGLAAVAGLGLATGCERETGRLGEEWPVEHEAPLEGKGRLGGEDLADQEFYGTVTALSPGQVVLRNERGVELPLRIDEDTRFVREGVTMRPQELHEGANVRVAYDERGGAYIADEVTVYPSPVPERVR